MPSTNAKHYWEKPELSTLCQNSTRITQNMVEDQESFPGVFSKFQKWLNTIQKKKDLRFATERCDTVNRPNVTFCSWSGWELELFFEIECQRAGINVLPHFRTWIDARKACDVIIESKFSMNILKISLFHH